MIKIRLEMTSQSKKLKMWFYMKYIDEYICPLTVYIKAQKGNNFEILSIVHIWLYIYINLTHRTRGIVTSVPNTLSSVW
jgi:hypothetical protein